MCQCKTWTMEKVRESFLSLEGNKKKLVGKGRKKERKEEKKKRKERRKKGKEKEEMKEK